MYAAASVCLLPAFHSTGSAAPTTPDLAVRGKASWHLYRADESVQSTTEYSFSIQMGAAGWSIALSQDQPDGYSEFTGSDGTDTYRFIDNRRVKAAPANATKVLATVHPGAFPADATKASQVLWLIFFYPRYCSASHPAAPVKLAQISYMVPDGGKMSVVTDEHTQVLKSIEFLSSGSYVLAQRTLRAKPPLDNGYKLWELTVSETTNASEHVIPEGAQYLQYFPEESADGSGRLSRLWAATVRVQTVAVHATFPRESLLPIVTASAVITIDHRFSTETGSNAVDSVHKGTPVTVYRVSDGRWLSRDEAARHERYSLTQTTSTSHDVSAGHRRLVRLLLLPLVAAPPAVMCLRFAVQKTKKRNHKRRT